MPWLEHVLVSRMDMPKAKDEWIGIYEDHIQTVQEAFSKERLLVFNVKQGWAPLMDFLLDDDDDKASSSLAATAFPNVNDLGALQTIAQLMDLLAVTAPLWILLITGMVVWAVWFGVQLAFQSSLVVHGGRRKHQKTKAE